MGTKEIKLTTYINSMESLYSKAREDYVKVVNELSKNDERHKNAISSGNLSPKGVENENDRYYSQKKALQQQLSEIREAFKKGVGEIRNSVDALFRTKYRVSSDDIDLKAVELLKSGMLTDNELLEMANIYKEQGNLCMFRYCGTFADKNDLNPSLKQLAIDSKRMREREDLSVLDGFAEVCLHGLRDDVMLSNGIDKRHEGFYLNSYAAAQKITTRVSTPWDSEKEG